MSTLVSSDRVLCVVSLGWLALVIGVPTLHAHEPAFFGTVLLILVNMVVSFWRLTREREVLIALNCVQIALFGLLNFQLHNVFGAGHYRYDREPQFYDWIEFTAAHIVRAADVLDALDEYGLPVQTINHKSTAAGILLVCMHLTVDGFLIGLLLRWLKRRWQEGPSETRLARGRREFAWVLTTLTLFVGFAAGQRLSLSDWILWPLDNVLRLVDIGDMFQIFGWRLHGVEPTYWTKLAAVLFRFAAGVWVARLVIWLRMTLLQTWGVSIDELTQMLDDQDADVRRGAALGLGQSGPFAISAGPALIEALHDMDREVRRAAAWALGRIGPGARAATDRLVDALWLGDRPMRLAAAEALGRIRPSSAVQSLATILKVSDDETRQAVTRALAQIAPAVLERLPAVGEVADHKPPKVKPWQLSLDAAKALHDHEDAVHSLLGHLLEDGYFAEERDTDAIRAACAEKGRGVEFTELYLPLLALTTDGVLQRRRDERGRWVYRDPRLSSVEK